MPKLNLYEDLEGNEFLAIITSPKFDRQCQTDPNLKELDSVPLEGYFTPWPTDRLFSQDMFK